MGNGQKAQMRRDRQAKDQKKSTSQKKANEAAKNIVCTVCRQTFLCTTRERALNEHSENRHSKSVQDCFPGFVETV